MWQVAPWPAEGLPSVQLERWARWMKLQETSLPVASFSGVTMQNLCRVLLGLLFCQYALLVKPSAHFQPLQLNLTEGETAKFTCSISNIDLRYDLNWYKLGHDHQPIKLDGSSQKYSISKLDAQTYEMQIQDLEKNDSGTYFCWANSFSSKETIMESNRANLTVTDLSRSGGDLTDAFAELEAAAVQPPGEITPVEEKGEVDGTDTNAPLAAFRGSGLILVFVVLYFFVLNIRRRRQEQEKQKSGNAPLGEDPPAVAVFTVDYEMLEFPGGVKSRPAPPKGLQQEQTEYATIVFLSKTPAAAEADGSKSTSCPVCVQQP